jgi:hypothetical protein
VPPLSPCARIPVRGKRGTRAARRGRRGGAARRGARGRGCSARGAGRAPTRNPRSSGTGTRAHAKGCGSFQDKGRTSLRLGGGPVFVLGWVGLGLFALGG